MSKTMIAGRAVGPGIASEIRAAQRRPAGGAINFTPPSQAAVREAIAEGKCPFCGSGPWKMLPVHTNKTHGIDKWELRDLAGLSTTDPLCSPEAREKMSEAAKRNPDSIRRATEASRKPRPNRRTTAAGRARNTAAITAWMQDNPEAAHAAAVVAARAVTAEGRARQAEANRQRFAENPDLRADFVARVQTPEARAARAAAIAASRVLQPCGTVASYKRGCRCEDCKSAKRASRYRDTP